MNENGMDILGELLQLKYCIKQISSLFNEHDDD